MARTIRVLLLASALSLPMFTRAADGPAAPTRAELDAITARGQLLYQLDQLAWHGTDAVLARKPDESRVRMFIPYQDLKGGHCAFGTLSDDGQAFLTAYESTTRAATASDGITVETFEPPRRDTGFLLRAARAREAAMKVFEVAAGTSYNSVLVPESDGSVSVYVMPSTTDPNALPLGADGVVNVSVTGETRVTRFHKGLLVRERKPNTEALVHTHVLDCTPSPNDVFFVLTWSQVPEYVACTTKRLFVIAKDGRIDELPWPKDLDTK